MSDDDDRETTTASRHHGDDANQESADEDSGIYGKEIEALQQTLQQLVMATDTAPATTESGVSTNGHSTDDADADEDQFSEDFVPTHLVSVPRHTMRRRSDPGCRMGTFYRPRSPFASDSSEDDDFAELSPRARSPRRFMGRLPEDEYYPGPHCVADIRATTPGWASPRRRLYQSRPSYPGDESPRRRRNRSHSLPLPDRVALGEAVGAIAVHNSRASAAAAVKRGRVALEERPLEAILEDETVAEKNHRPRRYSVPNYPFQAGRLMLTGGRKRSSSP